MVSNPDALSNKLACNIADHMIKLSTRQQNDNERLSRDLKSQCLSSPIRDGKVAEEGIFDLSGGIHIKKKNMYKIQSIEKCCSNVKEAYGPTLDGHTLTIVLGR
jgi:diaminopimelate decarboxylase